MYSLYEVPRRSRLCYQCSAPFVPGSIYYSLLTDQRKDFCPNCFQNQMKGGIFWKAQIPEKPKVQTKQAERALDLLREIYQEQKETAYILALYLQRQKLIIKRQEHEDLILFEVVDTEEILTIKKVELPSLDIERIRAEIAKKLEY